MVSGKWIYHRSSPSLPSIPLSYYSIPSIDVPGTRCLIIGGYHMWIQTLARSAGATLPLSNTETIKYFASTNWLIWSSKYESGKVSHYYCQKTMLMALIRNLLWWMGGEHFSVSYMSESSILTCVRFKPYMTLETTTMLHLEIIYKLKKLAVWEVRNVDGLKSKIFFKYG